ncbi:MAG: inositol monophosphatase [Candidatus Magasanikbacteria bacterium]|nr:inositol monophosphatase [Candidatus Magasanikbacteria bacterium]
MIDQFLKDTIREAGALAKGYFQKGVSARAKAHLGDLVTEADEAVSDFFIKKIQQTFPDHAIHSEEMKNDINPGAQFEWIIDPIDGTRNFAKGIPMWCIMVAVYENGEPQFAAVYQPLVEELFFAVKGRGASLNGLPIRVNEVSSLDHGYGLAVRTDRPSQKEPEFKRLLDRINNNTTVWMHNLGTMLASCYLASGGVDFFAENAGFDYDYAAPALICAEAGAVVTDADGNPWRRGRRDIVMANPKLHLKVLELLK